jgi:hypothetical protein
MGGMQLSPYSLGARRSARLPAGPIGQLNFWLSLFKFAINTFWRLNWLLPQP